MTTYPPVVIVNTEDKVVDWAPLGEAWAKGLIHRIVFVIVEDGQGRILLHKRAQGMKLYPGRWDTVGGHVDVTPDYEESARIELREEAGIDDADLDEVARLYLEEPYDIGVLAKRFVRIFRTRHQGERSDVTEEEVAASRWFTRAEVAELGRHPDEIAEGLHRCIPYILKEHDHHRHQTAGQADRPILHLR